MRVELRPGGSPRVARVKDLRALGVGAGEEEETNLVLVLRGVEGGRVEDGVDLLSSIILWEVKYIFFLLAWVVDLLRWWKTRWKSSLSGGS